MSRAKIDEEVFLDSAISVAKEKLNLKLVEISNEKNDNIGLEDLTNGQYTEDITEQVLNYSMFCHYGIAALSPISKGGHAALQVELFFDIIFVNSQDHDATELRKKANRYTRALREVFFDHSRNFDGVSDVEVGSLAPSDFKSKSGNGHFKIAGIVIAGTIG